MLQVQHISNHATVLEQLGSSVWDRRCGGVRRAEGRDEGRPVKVRLGMCSESLSRASGQLGKMESKAPSVPVHHSILTTVLTLACRKLTESWTSRLVSAGE